MPTPEEEIGRALRIAGSRLVERPLNDQDEQRLKDKFARAKGSPYQRALAALSDALGLEPANIVEKTPSSDNADRAMRDLRRVLDRLK
jgi:hypothetical protein